MADQLLTQEEQHALNQFKAIREVLRVPFPEDMRDLAPPVLPRERRWKGLCLGYVSSD